jgi:hypothetical protein
MTGRRECAILKPRRFRQKSATRWEGCRVLIFDSALFRRLPALLSISDSVRPGVAVCLAVGRWGREEAH